MEVLLSEINKMDQRTVGGNGTDCRGRSYGFC